MDEIQRVLPYSPFWACTFPQSEEFRGDLVSFKTLSTFSSLEDAEEGILSLQGIGCDLYIHLKCLYLIAVFVCVETKVCYEARIVVLYGLQHTDTPYAACTVGESSTFFSRPFPKCTLALNLLNLLFLTVSFWRSGNRFLFLILTFSLGVDLSAEGWDLHRFYKQRNIRCLPVI